VGRVANVEDFDEIEFQAARTGDHVQAAARMSELAQQAEPGLRAEFHLRAGEQWMSADDPQRAADEFSAAIEDGGANKATTVAMANLAEAIQGLVQHMRSEQQMIRDWAGEQAKLNRDLRRFMEQVAREPAER